MIRTNDLLKNVLFDIEDGIRNGINSDTIAKKHTLSSIHLQRLFKFTFKQTLGSYIRFRKLTASLENLFNTNSKIVDIAIEYGFEHEESYIRSFKREFGISPGKLRKSLNNGNYFFSCYCNNLFSSENIGEIKNFHFDNSR
jgi:AraC family transcriptional regulator